MLTLCCHRVGALQGAPLLEGKSLLVQVCPLRTLLLEKPTTEGLPAHVAAASGLVRVGDWLHVVPDDSLHLASFLWAQPTPGRSTALFGDALLPVEEGERKRLKPDLESLTLTAWSGGQALLSLGSGSTSRRCRGVFVPLTSEGAVAGEIQSFDLTGLYEALPFAALNIEGVAVVHDRLFLGQRGNSEEGVNALIELDLERALQTIAGNGRWGPELLLEHHRLELGQLHGVNLSLTDISALGTHSLLLSAAAEDTANTYDDGDVVGSVVGRYCLRTHETRCVALEGEWKIEGVEAIGEDGLWMVTDGDDPKQPALLLEAQGVRACLF